MSYTPRLKEKYQAVIIKDLTEQFGYKSTMRVPKLTKIVLSQGMGDAVADKKLIENAAADLSRIAGQKAVQTLSKKDVSKIHTSTFSNRSNKTICSNWFKNRRFNIPCTWIIN